MFIYLKFSLLFFKGYEIKLILFRIWKYLEKERKGKILDKDYLLEMNE